MRSLILFVGLSFLAAGLFAGCSNASSELTAEALADRLTDALDFENGSAVAGDPPVENASDSSYPQITKFNAPDEVAQGASIEVDLNTDFSKPDNVKGAVVVVEKATSFIKITKSLEKDITPLLMKLLGRLREDEDLVGHSFTIKLGLLDDTGKVGNYKEWELNLPEGTSADGDTGEKEIVEAVGERESIEGEVGIAMVSAGDDHTCILTSEGEVQCWGNNGNGQLGDGTTKRQNTPTNARLSSIIAAVSAGGNHTCAVTSGGGVKCWGENLFGQLGLGHSEDRNSPVDVSGLASGIKAVSAGDDHTCALTEASGLKCWGSNLTGQLGHGKTTGADTPVDVSGLASGVKAVSAGGNHTCALTETGGLKCWGGMGVVALDDYTPVDVSGLASGVKAVSVGGSHTCALTEASGVKCWGANDNGRLGDGTTTARSAPLDVSGLASGVIAVSAGGSYTCALTEAGGVKCWGNNANGQLGDGTTTERHTPVDVSGLSYGVAAISAGSGHTCALTTGGGVKCWGNNGYGELGDGTMTDRFTPVDVIEGP